jgi:hypothetical protein
VIDGRLQRVQACILCGHQILKIFHA